MIIIRLKGGLGNQLFNFALGYSLRHKGHRVFFDTALGFCLIIPIAADSVGWLIDRTHLFPGGSVTH